MMFLVVLDISHILSCIFSGLARSLPSDFRFSTLPRKFPSFSVSGRELVTIRLQNSLSY